MRNPIEVTVRWLGIAGIELGFPGRRIVFDPYFTRLPFRDMFFSHVRCKSELVQKHINPCDAIFITHSHVDHLLDAAEAARLTGAVIYGSPNTCRILRVEDLPSRQIIEIRPGAVFELGDVRVTALAQIPHPFVFGFGMQRLKKDLTPPLRAGDYAMDYGLSFLVECGGFRLLTDQCLHPEEAGRVDMIFLNPLHPGKKRALYFRSVIDSYGPRLIIPIHWDDMWSPFSAPIRGQLAPTGRVFPPLARFNVSYFQGQIESIPLAPRVFLPERMREYRVDELLGKEK